jgi:hypothetical protein
MNLNDVPHIAVSGNDKWIFQALFEQRAGIQGAINAQVREVAKRNGMDPQRARLVNSDDGRLLVIEEDAAGE